jgi:hypothetical protein
LGLSQEVEDALASEIGVADPAYRALVLSGQASALDYDVSTRARYPAEHLDSHGCLAAGRA